MKVLTFHSFGAVLLPSGHDRDGAVTLVRWLLQRARYSLLARHDGTSSTRERRKFACNNYEQH